MDTSRSRGYTIRFDHGHIHEGIHDLVFEVEIAGFEPEMFCIAVQRDGHGWFYHIISDFGGDDQLTWPTVIHSYPELTQAYLAGFTELATELEDYYS